ncbi:MAG: alpha/beta hydrolase-fold protein [Polyangiaceae bacterium]
MTPTRPVFSVIALLSITGMACSSGSSPASTAQAGSSGQGETVGGGNAQSGGSGTPQPGTGGDTQAGSGGSAQAGGGSTPAGSGGSTQAGSGGRSGTAGGGGTGLGGAGTGVSGGGGKAGAGSGGAGGTGAGGGAGTDATKSGGCDIPKKLQNGTINITSGGASRKYILRVPDSYDISHPYRLVFAFAESGSSAMSVVSRNYFTLATLDSKNTIFVAPDAANGAGSWSKADVDLTDAILTEVEAGLCIDKSRIFATGFSFGGAMSLALACTRADVFRGVAFFSGADLTGSCPATLTKPIAYYASQASQDSTGTPMPSSGKVKQAEFAAVNGCTPEPNALTFPASGQAHTCTDYKGCSAGHPTKYCVFDGQHGWEPKDPGQTTSWDAAEAWKFITQF